MRTKSTLFVFSAVLASGALPASAAVFESIDYPGAIYTSVDGGPNPQGDVVGSYIDKANQIHGFVRSRSGVFTIIDYPGALHTQLSGWVDARGDIVGHYTDQANKTHGFLLLKRVAGQDRQGPDSVRFYDARSRADTRSGTWGTFTTIDYPNATYTALTGINNSGVMIGTYCMAGYCGAFLDNDGVFATITNPGAVITGGATISDSGSTVTFCTVNGVSNLCLLVGGNLTLVNFPGSMGTEPGAGNSYNDVVGAFKDQKLVTHAFLWSNGVYTQIDYPGATFTYAGGVNDQQWVAGEYYDAQGNSHGFLYHH